MLALRVTRQPTMAQDAAGPVLWVSLLVGWRFHPPTTVTVPARQARVPQPTLQGPVLVRFVYYIYIYTYIQKKSVPKIGANTQWKGSVVACVWESSHALYRCIQVFTFHTSHIAAHLLCRPVTHAFVDLSHMHHIKIIMHGKWVYKSLWEWIDDPTSPYVEIQLLTMAKLGHMWWIPLH